MAENPTPTPRRSRSKKSDTGAAASTPLVTPPPAVTAPSVPPVPGNEAMMTSMPPVPPVPRVPPPPGAGQNPYAAAVARDVAPRPTFWQSLGRAIGAVFGWLIALALGILLAVALLVFNVPPFNMFPNPLNQNAQAIADLKGEISGLQDTIATLEAQNAAAEEVMQATAAANAEQIAALQQGAEEQSSTIGGVEESIQGVDARIASLQSTLTSLEEELPGEAEFNEYNRQLLLMRAWKEVFAARQYLLENNPGLALDEVARAQGTLAEVQRLSSPEQLAALQPVIDRLSLVISGVRTSPFAASSDIDVAWRALGELIAPPGVTVIPASPVAAATPTLSITPGSTTTP